MIKSVLFISLCSFEIDQQGQLLIQILVLVCVGYFVFCGSSSSLASYLHFTAETQVGEMNAAHNFGLFAEFNEVLILKWRDRSVQSFFFVKFQGNFNE